MGNVIHQVAAQQELITCFTFGDVAVVWPTCLLASEILRPHRLGLLFGATRPCCDTVPISNWTRLCKDCLDALAILRLPAAALINSLPVSFVRYFIDEIAGLQSLRRDHVGEITLANVVSRLEHWQPAYTNMHFARYRSMHFAVTTAAIRVPRSITLAITLANVKYVSLPRMFCGCSTTDHAGDHVGERQICQLTTDVLWI